MLGLRGRRLRNPVHIEVGAVSVEVLELVVDLLNHRQFTAAMLQKSRT
jgi:hypothetical protein